MKVKIVLSFFATLMLLASCGTKDWWKSPVTTVDWEQEQKKEETYVSSSNIGGWQGEPDAEAEIFNN